MSLVKKKLQEIEKKALEKKNKKKQKQSDKPIEVHNIYKNLIKKNDIFKDLKDLEKETKKITPHFFYNLNHNSNNYLAKLKKIDFTNGVFNDLHSSHSEDREWLGCIIFADIYYKTREQHDETNIYRIGFSIDHSDDDLKPNSWFYVRYNHWFMMESKISELGLNAFKTYDEMMSNFIEKLMEVSSSKDTVFKKPFGGFLNLYKKSYDFTDSVSLINYNKIHSW